MRESLQREGNVVVGLPENLYLEEVIIMYSFSGGLLISRRGQECPSSLCFKFIIVCLSGFLKTSRKWIVIIYVQTSLYPLSPLWIFQEKH